MVRRTDAGAGIAELRRLSGLTWAQLARLFAVSRRSLHFWASGKPLTPANEERLNRMLATLRRIDRGSALANRALLLGPDRDGQIPFDMLAEGRFEHVASLLGGGAVAPGPAGKRPSISVQAARTPPAPDTFVDALQDRVHVEKARLISAKPIRVPRGK
jgi:transcriptional regulator with XRE-family HTH domain